jgi:hypothetical protein
MTLHHAYLIKTLHLQAAASVPRLLREIVMSIEMTLHMLGYHCKSNSPDEKPTSTYDVHPACMVYYRCVPVRKVRGNPTPTLADYPRGKCGDDSPARGLSTKEKQPTVQHVRDDISYTEAREPFVFSI